MRWINAAHFPLTLSLLRTLDAFAGAQEASRYADRNLDAHDRADAHAREWDAWDAFRRAWDALDAHVECTAPGCHCGPML